MVVAKNSKLDLTNNSLILRSDRGTREESLVRLTELIRSARNAQSVLWKGYGITTSAAGDYTGLGILLNDVGVVGQPMALYSTFSGQAVDENSVLVKFTYNGDANLDGLINADDYFQVDSGYITQARGWFNGDFTYDGRIDADDYFLIDSAFIAQGAVLSSRGVVVPEPTSLMVFGGGAVLLLAGRRRRVGLR